MSGRWGRGLDFHDEMELVMVEIICTLESTCIFTWTKEEKEEGTWNRHGVIPA